MPRKRVITQPMPRSNSGSTRSRSRAPEKRKRAGAATEKGSRPTSSPDAGVDQAPLAQFVQDHHRQHHQEHVEVVALPHRLAGGPRRQGPQLEHPAPGQRAGWPGPWR